jgi:DNA repair protein RecO (recombination protein O)
MPLRDTEAFVLRTYTLKEADKICVFLTRDAGKVRGVAYGARKVKSRYGASLEPFTEVALTYFEKETRELVSVSNCEIIQSQFELLANSESLGVLHYLAELLIEFLPDHEPNPRAYRLAGALMGTLRGLEPEKLPALARYAEVWMLKLAGFFADWRHCGECLSELDATETVWISADGAPLCANCSDQRGEEFPSHARTLLHEILRLAPDKFVARPRDPRSLARIESVAARLIRHALERELRSYELLNRLKPETNVAGSRKSEVGSR